MDRVREVLIKAMRSAGWSNTEAFVTSCSDDEILNIIAVLVDNHPAVVHNVAFYARKKSECEAG
jgi:hypothetical protein